MPPRNTPNEGNLDLEALQSESESPSRSRCGGRGACRRSRKTHKLGALPPLHAPPRLGGQYLLGWAGVLPRDWLGGVAPGRTGDEVLQLIVPRQAEGRRQRLQALALTRAKQPSQVERRQGPTRHPPHRRKERGQPTIQIRPARTSPWPPPLCRRWPCFRSPQWPGFPPPLTRKASPCARNLLKPPAHSPRLQPRDRLYRVALPPPVPIRAVLSA